MARLDKSKLIDVVLSAIRAAGWTVSLINAPGAHPARFTMTKGTQQHAVRVYIWNLTHGGGVRRPKHEYRIQITSGVNAFELEPDGVTLILGWSEQFGVFAAFDASRRTASLGASPSIQISQATLTQARDMGGAIQDKGSGEFAVAVRPDLLTTYVTHQKQAHAGDVSTIVLSPRADSEAEALDDPILDEAAEGQREFRIGNSAEIDQRRNVLERLEALEREMAQLRPVSAGRGHNRPPELLPVEAEAAAEEIEKVSSNIRSELEKPTPGVANVARAGKFLRWVVTSVKAVTTEAGKIGQKIKEKARDRAAELVIGGIVSGGALWDKIARLVEAVVAEIVRWLHLIF